MAATIMVGALGGADFVAVAVAAGGDWWPACNRKPLGDGRYSGTAAVSDSAECCDCGADCDGAGNCGRSSAFGWRSSVGCDGKGDNVGPPLPPLRTGMPGIVAEATADVDSAGFAGTERFGCVRTG